MLLILLGLLVELYRPIRTYLTVKNEDPVVNVEFGSLEMLEFYAQNGPYRPP